MAGKSAAKPLTAQPDSIALSIQERLNNFLKQEKDIVFDLQDKPELIRTGIAPLDTILGGGAILGGFIQLVGRAGCGKSSLAAKIISSFQQLSNGQALVLYIDTESTMTKFRLEQLGVNNPSINPINDCRLEDVFKVIDSVIEFKSNNKDAQTIPTVIVWDSIANTKSVKEAQAEDPKEVIGWNGRLLSMYLPKIKYALKAYRITIIAINQLRDQVSISMTPTPVAIKGMKQSETIPGGRSLQYSTDQLIYMSDCGNIEEKVCGFDGKEVEMYCIKNKAFPPLVKCKTTFSYLGGYSNFWSMFSTLKEEKFIVSAGAYYSMEGFGKMEGEKFVPKKFFAKHVTDLYRNDPEFKRIFDSLIKQHCTNVVHKYLDQQESCNIDDQMAKEGAVVVNVMADDQYRKVKMYDPNEVVEAPNINIPTNGALKETLQEVDNTKGENSITMNVPPEVDPAADFVID